MNNEHFMSKALGEAEQALTVGEFPVGCVMVYKNEILVSGTRHGSTQMDCNELDHAEMLALKRLVELDRDVERGRITVFATLVLCLMCISALIENGITRIV